MKRIISKALAAMVITATVALQAQAQDITVIDLGNLGGEVAAANGLNDLGHVVGRSNTAGGETHAFLWTKEGGMVNIGAQIRGQSIAYAINNQGQVVGAWEDADHPGSAFLWSAEGGFVDLGILQGTTTSTAVDINNSGEVVGVAYSLAVPIGFHTFYWSQATGMIDIGTLGGSGALAFEINDLGQIIGFSSTAAGSRRVFLWSAAEGMKDTGVEPSWGGGAGAISINNRGQIVITQPASPGSGVSHPFLLLPDGRQKDLGTLGGQDALSTSINDLGQVVGGSQTPDGSYHAFIWSEETGMIDLGTLGLPNSIAVEINNAGQIAGYGLSADGTAAKALLWTLSSPPTPQEQIANIISEVQELLSEGTIARGEAMAMLAKLDAAAALFGEGNAAAGCNVLQAFINHTTARRKTGKVPADEAQALIDAAQYLSGCGALQ